MTQPNPNPTPVPQIGNGKVYAAGISGAAVVVLAWVLHQFAHVDLPPEVQASVQTILTGAAVYFVPHGG